MECPDFFNKQLTKDQLNTLLGECGKDSLDEKLAWVLKVWDAEKARDDQFRNKGDKLFGLHILALSTIIGGVIQYSAPLLKMLSNGISLALLLATAVVVIGAAITGLISGMRIITIRFRRVIDPTLVLTVKGEPDSWNRAAIVHVLDAYKRDVKDIGKLAFDVRLLRDFLCIMALTSLVGTVSAWAANSVGHLDYPLLCASAGIIVGAGALFLVIRLLITNPRPHSN